MKRTFKTLEELPVMLNSIDIASCLGISRPMAYILLNREDFPTLKVGGRLIVNKYAFIRWIEENTRKQTEA